MIKPACNIVDRPTCDARVRPDDLPAPVAVDGFRDAGAAVLHGRPDVTRRHPLLRCDGWVQDEHFQSLRRERERLHVGDQCVCWQDSACC